MKKILKVVMALGLIFALTACGGKKNANSSNGEGEKGESKKIEKLTVQFVPSRDPEQIVTQTEPLKNILKEKLKEKGYEVGDVDISVGTNYETTGEALSAGSVDVGFIPGGTYVLYSEDVKHY